MSEQSVNLPTDFMSDIAIETELVSKVLTRFIREELGRVGFTKAVLGLSGGIDSAVSCYLAAQALGAENVLVIRMPYETSSAESLTDAGLIIEDLGLPNETIEITPIVEPLFDASADITPHRKGNIMARARMMITYDRSMAFNGLVVGTSNKTEMLLGYGTIFGDLAHALNPIGDLYKTQVRQLARAIGVPEAVITKPPSADLIPGQSDEDDFGFSYETADQILYLLVDERYTPDEVIAHGFSPAIVAQIGKMIQRNQYKRVQPLIPKISGRTIGHDFRYLRDWGT